MEVGDEAVQSSSRPTFPAPTPSAPAVSAAHVPLLSSASQGVSGQRAEESPWQLALDAEDFDGELQRKVPRVQALSSASPSMWQREWCVLSHNFLVFFASQTNLVVNKCILLSAVESCKAETNGIFRIALRPPSGALEAEKSGRSGGAGEREIVLRVPEVPKESVKSAAGQTPKQAAAEVREASVRHWVEAVNRHAQLVEKSGKKLLACLPLTQAHELRANVAKELHLAEQRKELEDRCRLLEAQKRTSAVVIFGLLTKARRYLVREGFEELALHSRLKAVHAAQRHAAIRRLDRALQQPNARLVRSSFFDWLAFRGSPQALLRQQKAFASQKRVQLGVDLLNSLFRGSGRDSTRWAMASLRRHAEVKRAEATALASATDAAAESRHCGDLAFDPPPRRGGVAANGVGSGRRDGVALVAQRIKVGAHLLKTTLRNREEFLRAWSLRSWAVFAARIAEAEAAELARCSKALNEEMSSRCRQVALETHLNGMVRSIRAAQMRKVLLAFLLFSKAERRSTA